MLRKIYQELVAIRKELQAINKSLEPKTIKYSITKGKADSERQACAYCKKIILKKDKYCQYCGKPTEKGFS